MGLFFGQNRISQLDLTLVASISGYTDFIYKEIATTINFTKSFDFPVTIKSTLDNITFITYASNVYGNSYSLVLPEEELTNEVTYKLQFYETVSDTLLYEFDFLPRHYVPIITYISFNDTTLENVVPNWNINIYLYGTKLKNITLRCAIGDINYETEEFVREGDYIDILTNFTYTSPIPFQFPSVMTRGKVVVFEVVDAITNTRVYTDFDFYGVMRHVGPPELYYFRLYDSETFEDITGPLTIGVEYNMQITIASVGFMTVKIYDSNNILKQTVITSKEVSTQSLEDILVLDGIYSLEQNYKIILTCDEYSDILGQIDFTVV